MKDDKTNITSSTQTSGSVSSKKGTKRTTPKTSLKSRKQQKKSHSKKTTITGIFSNKKNEEFEKLKQSFQYLQAEFANYKKSSFKENENIRQYAISYFIEELLSDVINDFNHAIEKEVDNNNVEEFKKGIDILHKKFIHLLKKFNVEEINPQKGEEFNPHLYEAISQSPSEEIAKNHILYVCRKGYKLKDRLIQAAQVVTSSGTAKNEEDQSS